MRVGVIGAGHIGAPIARHLARHGHEVSVSPRNAEIAQSLAGEFPNITIRENQEIIDHAEALFLALRPHIAGGVLEPLKFRADHQICSVMTNISMSRLGALAAPAHRISLTIPIGFLEHGGCPLPALGDTHLLEETLGVDNPILPQASEDALNAHFAASTMLSAVLSTMMAGADWLGAETGDENQAELYINQLLTGFLRDIPKSGMGDLEKARSALATKGTLNLQMVEALEREEIALTLNDALIQINNSMKSQ